MVDKCINLPLRTDRVASNVGVIVSTATIIPTSTISQSQAIHLIPPALLENLRNASTK